MKKALSLILALAMVFTLAACGNKQGETSSEGTSTEESTPGYTVPDSVMNMMWAAGPTGGVTYPLGAAVSEMISSKLAPGAQITLFEGAGATNVEMVNSGEALMGHTMGDTAYCATKGMQPFDGVKDNFCTWARVSDFQFQFIVPVSLGVTSFQDIFDKGIALNLGTNNAGSSAEAITRYVLEEYGITYDWIKEHGGSTTFTSFSDGVVLMQDGHINAWGALTAAPSSYVQEMNLSEQMMCLPVDQNVMEKLASKYGYAIGSIPANAYDGMTEEVPTLISPMVLLCNKDLPEDFIYALCENFFTDEMYNNLLAVSTTFSNISLEYSSQNLGAPLHPGAEKFYKDKGVL